MMNKKIITQLTNKWHKVYWFSRMLINTDKYGGVGKDNKLLSTLAASLRLVAEENKKFSSKKILTSQKEIIKKILLKKHENAFSKIPRIQKLIVDLNKEINDLEDMAVFVLTCEHVMLPINQAIENIPSDDREFSEVLAQTYLKAKGERGLSTVITLWDDLGVKGCLTVERTEIVKAFSALRIILSQMKEMNVDNSDIILSAFAQEFERRAAQKRKSRAGTSLEDVTSFILNYFGISSTHQPEHFQADIEVDKWIKTKDGWLLGISCKRTLRERWKQVSSADSAMLSRFKIKRIYHILTYDEDLSDDKLTMLGSQRHVFYLPDESRILKYAREHIGLKDYVGPISRLISDIKKEL